MRVAQMRPLSADTCMSWFRFISVVSRKHIQSEYENMNKVHRIFCLYNFDSLTENSMRQFGSSGSLIWVYIFEDVAEMLDVTVLIHLQ